MRSKKNTSIAKSAKGKARTGTGEVAPRAPISRETMRRVIRMVALTRKPGDVFNSAHGLDALDWYAAMLVDDATFVVGDDATTRQEAITGVAQLMLDLVTNDMLRPIDKDEIEQYARFCALVTKSQQLLNGEFAINDATRFQVLGMAEFYGDCCASFVVNAAAAMLRAALGVAEYRADPHQEHNDGSGAAADLVEAALVMVRQLHASVAGWDDDGRERVNGAGRTAEWGPEATAAIEALVAKLESGIAKLAGPKLVRKAG